MPRNPDSPGAIRNRRYRERQRAGRSVVPSDISDDVIDGLVLLGFLPPWLTDNPEAVAEALAAYIENAIVRDVMEHIGPCDASRHDTENVDRIDTIPREVSTAHGWERTSQPVSREGGGKPSRKGNGRTE